MADTPDHAPPPLVTPLNAAHRALGARMVPFAGYDMPVQYSGILAEHLHTRASAGLFDVSHMGQAFLVGPDHASTARFLESLVPADILHLRPGAQRYSQFLSPDGGTLDDLMIHRPHNPDDDGTLMLVVNAARKDHDFDLIRRHLPADIRLDIARDRALLALQGPKAVDVLVRLGADVADWTFMTAGPIRIGTLDAHASRSGYTGEDGFEISVHDTRAADLWSLLLAAPEVLPVGLGARDSLRLEAGLCLYGHDLDETTSPVEAGLAWSIQPRRRLEGGFPGAERIQFEIANGPARRRVGLKPEGRQPAREGTEIRDLSGRHLGTVTSGGFGPTVGGPIAMGYVAAASAAPGTKVVLMVRGRELAAEIVPLPFVPANFVRRPA
ncbi:glycine cleavage system aminomethyltransferase GcvT [Methylobrevis pamukkalensis]|uniref:aminomethyltransferase n=1 Tax=Methylobrevis pamukkalensis TaxID=1439726 RepID=A0A1E3H4Z4_9HYPH|nr:glycine cleavage system aminomethyltransferase GcvT [Methylobrevis pamukkalensis]ODN71399.1 Aminomethyltransferase [Methylobrevis pamukkalensis]